MAFFLSPVCNLQAPLQKPENLFDSEGNRSFALIESLPALMTVILLGATGRLKPVTERLSWELRCGVELVNDRSARLV